ncbi:MAG: hypothetical protein AAGI90_02365, partial [Chlamydiota bacterium]
KAKVDALHVRSEIAQMQEQLSSEKASAQQKIEKLREELKNHQSGLIRLDTLLKQKGNALSTLKQKLASTKAADSDQIRKLQQQKERLAEELRTVKTDSTKAKQELKKTEDLLTTTQNQLNQTTSALKQATKHLSEKTDELAKKSREASKLNKDTPSVSEEVVKYKEELAKYKNYAEFINFAEQYKNQTNLAINESIVKNQTKNSIRAIKNMLPTSGADTFKASLDCLEKKTIQLLGKLHKQDVEGTLLLHKVFHVYYSYCKQCLNDKNNMYRYISLFNLCVTKLIAPIIDEMDKQVTAGNNRVAINLAFAVTEQIQAFKKNNLFASHIHIPKDFEALLKKVAKGLEIKNTTPWTTLDTLKYSVAITLLSGLSATMLYPDKGSMPDQLFLISAGTCLAGGASTLATLRTFVNNQWLKLCNMGLAHYAGKFIGQGIEKTLHGSMHLPFTSPKIATVFGLFSFTGVVSSLANSYFCSHQTATESQSSVLDYEWLKCSTLNATETSVASITPYVLGTLLLYSMYFGKTKIVAAKTDHSGKENLKLKKALQHPTILNPNAYYKAKKPQERQSVIKQLVMEVMQEQQNEKEIKADGLDRKHGG